jgi:hypothetical protein
VLHGWAAPSLLETYDAERRPVGRAITEQSLANSISMGRLGSAQAQGFARPEFLNEVGMIFGASYDSPAIVPDGTLPPIGDNPVTNYTPSGRPGGRAPHAWLERDGARVSTIDLVGKRFTVFGSGRAWREQLTAMGRQGHVEGPHSVPLDVVTIGEGAELEDPDRAWHAAYGVDEGGAVLVRPDGYVAWRASSAVKTPRAALHAAVASIVARS